jgi:protein-disulfide isomerase
MNSRLETALSIVLTCSAIAMAAAMTHRELRPTRSTQNPQQQAPPKFVPEWQSFLKAAAIPPDSVKPATILVFSDLECPFCKRFHQQVRKLEVANGATMSLAFVHFPLPQHRFAKLAAEAAECSRAQNRFRTFIDTAFAQQDSFGLKSWWGLAKEAGVSDSSRFTTCMADSKGFPLIDAGLRLGQQAAVRGTPTVIINGWQYNPLPSDSDLVRVVGAIARGRDPFKGTR